MVPRRVCHQLAQYRRQGTDTRQLYAYHARTLGGSTTYPDWSDPIVPRAA